MSSPGRTRGGGLRRLNRHGGPLSKSFWKAAGRALVDVHRVDVLAVSSTRPVRSVAPPGLVIQTIKGDTRKDPSPGVSDAREVVLAAIPQEYLRAATASLRLADVGFIALVGGRFSGWVWLTSRTQRDAWSGLVLHVAPTEMYVYGLYTIEEQRASGVGAALMAAALQAASQVPGVNRVFGWVDRDNRPSQMLLRLGFGFQTVQTLVRVRMLRMFGLPLPGSLHPRSGPVRLR